MSDSRKNFVCSKCGCVLNDTQRPWGSESICPVCYERERDKNKQVIVHTQEEVDALLLSGWILLDVRFPFDANPLFILSSPES